MYDSLSLGRTLMAGPPSRIGPRRKAVNDKFVILLLAVAIIGGVYFFIDEIFAYLSYLRILWGV